MSVRTIARRYAQALADVAASRGELERVEQELARFVNMFQSNRELVEVFASPVVPLPNKVKVLDAVVQRTEPCATVKSLLSLLLRHYRLQHLKVVSDEYVREVNRRAGILPAEVTTASPVAESDRQKLASKLEKLTGKRVQLQFKIDPDIIGGAVTRMGSIVYDGSIKTRLETIKQRLKSGEEATVSGTH